MHHRPCTRLLTLFLPWSSPFFLIISFAAVWGMGGDVVDSWGAKRIEV